MTDYQIVNYPPEKVYEKAKKKWGVDFEKGIVFTYGNTIHAKMNLTEDLLAHELTHVLQQTSMGKDEWWNRYFEDEQFRLREELQAYRTQYRWVKKNIKDRNIQARLLDSYARSLSGDMYGNMLTWSMALKLITTDA